MLSRKEIKKLYIFATSIDNFTAALITPVLMATILPALNKLFPMFSLLSTLITAVAASLIARKGILKFATNNFRKTCICIAVFDVIMLGVGLYSPVIMIFMGLLTTALGTFQETVIGRINNLFMSGEELSAFQIKKNKATQILTLAGAVLACGLVLVPHAYEIAIACNLIFVVTSLFTNLVLRTNMIKHIGEETFRENIELGYVEAVE